MIKTYDDFLQSLHRNEPENNWSKAIQSLWYDAKDDWQASHDIAQDLQTTLGSWIHAYLHRKEGDRFNAGYWYRQAGRNFPKETLAEEHQKIVEFALKKIN